LSSTGYKCYFVGQVSKPAFIGVLWSLSWFITGAASCQTVSRLWRQLHQTPVHWLHAPIPDTDDAADGVWT